MARVSSKTDADMIRNLAREIEGLPRPVKRQDIETVLWAAYGLGAGRLAGAKSPQAAQMVEAIVKGEPVVRLFKENDNADE